MNALARAIAFAAACLLAAALYATFANAVTEMYPAAQAAETAQRLAREETARVQAEQWGATVRGWAWPAAGIAVLIVVAVQTGRTLRHRESLDACVAQAQDAGRKYISVASYILAGDK